MFTIKLNIYTVQVVDKGGVMVKIKPDSKLWQEAYTSYKKTKPNYGSGNGQVKTRNIYAKKYVDPKHKVEGKESIQARIAEIDIQRKKLFEERQELRRRLKPWIVASEQRPWHLYVLKLEGGYWYVGISRDIDKRFTKHVKGKGAAWTKKHKPIEIHYRKKLDTCLESEASFFENELTLEYANNYGTNLVRGGGYCQTNPIWPTDLLGLGD